MPASIDSLIDEFQPYARALVDLVSASGFVPKITSALRTHAQQARLFRDYLRGGRQYPVAPPGTSAHEYGYAFDLVIQPMSVLHELGAIWVANGGVWSPRDEVHFQYPGFSPPALDVIGFFTPLRAMTGEIPPTYAEAAAAIEKYLGY